MKFVLGVLVPPKETDQVVALTTNRSSYQSLHALPPGSYPGVCRITNKAVVRAGFSFYQFCIDLTTCRSLVMLYNSVVVRCLWPAALLTSERGLPFFKLMVTNERLNP